MGMPTISNNFVISTQGEGIRILDRDGEGNPSQVAVDLYCDQSISQDDNHRFQSYSTMFFGRRASNFVEYFEPGDVVFIQGQQRIEIGEYTDINIRNASWDFVPSGNRRNEAAGGNGPQSGANSDNQNTTSNVGSPTTATPPQTPSDVPTGTPPRPGN